VSHISELLQIWMQIFACSQLFQAMRRLYGTIVLLVWVRSLGESYPIAPTGAPIGQHSALVGVVLEEMLLMLLGSPPGESIII